MRIIVTLVISFFIFSCSEDSPKKIPFEHKIVNDEQEVSDINSSSFRPKLDVLFVIDDSGSMDVHQKNLADNMDVFAGVIANTSFLDYHVGVVGSAEDTCCGKLLGHPKYVENSTPDAVDTIAENLIIGATGGTEKFFDPMIMALSPPLVNGHNKGFLRPDSFLAIIILTDSEDQSSKYNKDDAVNFLVKLKGSKERVLVGAAFVSDTEMDFCESEETELNKSDALPDFFAEMKAKTFSLCSDFGIGLAEIADIIVNKNRTMLLKKLPIEDTIVVRIGKNILPRDLKKGWTYNRNKNAIEFGPEIPWETFPDKAFPVVDFESHKVLQ